MFDTFSYVSVAFPFNSMTWLSSFIDSIRFWCLERVIITEIAVLVFRYLDRFRPRVISQGAVEDSHELYDGLNQKWIGEHQLYCTRNTLNPRHSPHHPGQRCPVRLPGLVNNKPVSVLKKPQIKQFNLPKLSSWLAWKKNRWGNRIPSHHGRFRSLMAWHNGWGVMVLKNFVHGAELLRDSLPSGSEGKDPQGGGVINNILYTM